MKSINPTQLCGDYNKPLLRCSMYGLFTYMRWNMATFKAPWFGKYSHPMEHLGIANPLSLGQDLVGRPVLVIFGSLFRNFGVVFLKIHPIVIGVLKCCDKPHMQGDSCFTSPYPPLGEKTVPNLLVKLLEFRKTTLVFLGKNTDHLYTPFLLQLWVGTKDRFYFLDLEGVEGWSP